MSSARAALSCLLAFSAAAWAQQAPPLPAPAPLGTVTQVDGLVTMSLGSQVGTVQPGTPVFDGARFVSSSSGHIEFNLPGGCMVKLQPNQLVQVDSVLSCNQQISSIVSLPGATGLGSGMFAARTALPLLGSAAMAAAVARVPEPEITPRPR